ncbi:protein YgfX [Chitiniphilus shinanonensis]|uniref:protein YgfX n=1 Tax=Chitiniphilus shinanonensis TaxID=553088 RepID=UPI003063BA58
MHSKPRVVCQFGPSRLGRFWTCGIHLAGGLIALTLPGWWLVPALAWVAASAWRDRRAGCATGQLRAPGDGTLWLDRGDGERLIEPLPGSLIGTALLVLRYRQGGRRCALVLWPDSAPARSLRRLRVWLRWRATGSP